MLDKRSGEISIFGRTLNEDELSTETVNKFDRYSTWRRLKGSIRVVYEVFTAGSQADKLQKLILTNPPDFSEVQIIVV